jgi:DNA end-binding protein Ku
MRPYWKGYLKLALVSCPIALHAACSTSERISFRQINKATGNRLRQQLVDEETREPVGPEYKGRGYEVAKRQYLVVEDEELEAIEIESTHVIEIDSFVPRQQIDQRFFDTPYYVTPNEPVAQEAFAVIREAMRHKAMVALGRLLARHRASAPRNGTRQSFEIRNKEVNEFGIASAESSLREKGFLGRVLKLGREFS